MVDKVVRYVVAGDPENVRRTFLGFLSAPSLASPQRQDLKASAKSDVRGICLLLDLPQWSYDGRDPSL